MHENCVLQLIHDKVLPPYNCPGVVEDFVVLTLTEQRWNPEIVEFGRSMYQ